MYILKQLHRFGHRRALSALVLPLLIAGAIGLFASGTAKAREAPAVPSAAPATTAAQAVQVMNFSYSPASFTATAGEALTVTVTNAGPSPHTFTISGVADSGQIASGTSKTVTLTPSQWGTLTFFCTIHGQNVMSGRITVQGAAAPAPAPQTTAQAPAPNTTVPSAPPTAPQAPRPPSTGDGGLLTARYFVEVPASAVWAW